MYTPVDSSHMIYDMHMVLLAFYHAPSFSQVEQGPCAKHA